MKRPRGMQKAEKKPVNWRAWCASETGEGFQAWRPARRPAWRLIFGGDEGWLGWVCFEWVVDGRDGVAGLFLSGESLVGLAFKQEMMLLLSMLNVSDAALEIPAFKVPFVLLGVVTLSWSDSCATSLIGHTTNGGLTIGHDHRPEDEW